MRVKKENLWVLLFIFILAFSIRLIFIVNNQDGIETDEVEYDRLAMQLLESKEYVTSDGSPTSYRPPLYPAFLTLIYRIFGHHFFAVRFVQALIGYLIVCLLYLMERKIFNNTVGILTVVFSSFYMTFIVCTNLLYTETLFMFLLVLIVYLVIVSDKPNIAIFCMLGFLCGFLTLIRSAGLFVPLVALLFLIIKAKKRRLSLKKVIMPSLLILSCFAIVIAPWIIRNYKAHGKFVLISTNGGINMYQGLCRPDDGMIFTFPPGTEMSVKYDTMTNEVERNNFFIRETLKIYKTRPLFALKMFVVRFLFFWNIIDWEILGGNVINYHYIFILPFAVLGTSFAFKDKKEVSFILLIILYFTSFVLLFPGTPRYRMPIDGYIIMLGSYGIFEIINRQKRKTMPTFCIGIYFLFTYFLYKYSLQTKYFVRSLMEKLGLW